MQIDQTTLTDLSIFHSDETQSVIHALDYSNTTYGRLYLRQLLLTPHQSLQPILDTQLAIQHIGKHLAHWPIHITNGTIMVIERFYQSQIDPLPANAGILGAFSYKLFHSHDFTLTKYTVGHCVDFLVGMQQIVDLIAPNNASVLIKKLLDKVSQQLQKPKVQELISIGSRANVTATQGIYYGHFLLYEFKHPLQNLMDWFGQLDAYYALAIATQKLNLVFPVFENGHKPFVSADGLYHLLLKKPIPYNLMLNHQNNFIFLTGANMAGKSTFIKSTGIAVYLAHIGMAVPASNMQLTLFDGILSNINVVDNIIKGESYFYNEVQRIKHTINRINDGKKWLVLIDELFKGTNVQDAMRCSSEVIKGLIKIESSLFVLSTHLYEIADELKPYENIAFRYFETDVTNGQLTFSYQLRNGISNDRLGYLILQREGVVDMLKNL